MIEKSFRKADFLRRIKNISPNRVFVHQAKLEELENINFDCIMSRALAPLDKLLEYCKKFLKDDGIYICEDVQNNEESLKIINHIKLINPNKDIKCEEFNINNKSDDRIIVVV